MQIDFYTKVSKNHTLLRNEHQRAFMIEQLNLIIYTSISCSAARVGVLGLKVKALKVCLRREAVFEAEHFRSSTQPRTEPATVP